MYTKIINVYYGTDALPYKDEAKTVHYPITSSVILGASDTTKIRYYLGELADDNAIWLAVSKRANNTQGSQFLTKTTDEQGNRCWELSINGWYTEFRGDIYISLKCYQGGTTVSWNETLQNYEIDGMPVIQSTGSIKLACNYVPTGAYPNYQDEMVVFNALVAQVGNKIDREDGIIVVSDIDEEVATNYDEGQLLYDVSEKALYRLVSGEFELFFRTYDKEYLDNEFADISSKLETNSLPRYVVSRNDNVLGFITNNILDGKPIVIALAESAGSNLIGQFRTIGGSSSFQFEFERLTNMQRFYSTNAVDMTDKTFSDLFMTDTYRHDCETTDNKVTSIGIDSTNTQYPSAKAVYDSEQALSQVLQTNINASGHSIVATINGSTYVMTIALKDANGNTLGTAQEIDLPLESVVVGGTYDDTTETIILTLKNGDTIDIPVHDLISGLVTETTYNAGMATKADKVGALPRFTDIGTENIINFITNNNLSGVPFIFDNHFAIFSSQYSTFYTFEIETLGTTNRYYGGSVNLSGLTFNDIINSTTYRDNYMLSKSVLPSFHVVSTDNVYNFLTVPPYDQHLNQPMILYIGDNPYFATFADYAPDNHYIYTSFELEKCDGGYPAGNVRYAGTFTDKTNTTFADLIGSTYSQPYELSNNKVSSWQSTPSDTNYPTEKLVKDSLDAKQNTLVSGQNIKTINNESILGSGNINIQGGSGATWGQITGTLSDQTDLNNELTDIREVAEGKCKTYVLSYSANAPTTDLEAQSLKKMDGTSFADMSDFNTYVNNAVINNLAFNSNSASLDITTDGNHYFYYIVDKNHVMVMSRTDFELDSGDIFLVIETDVPDRWVDSLRVAHILETTKVDLTSYATKSEVEQKSDLSNIAPAYNTTLTYTIGEVVRHDTKIYKCITAIATPESWDSSHWEQISVASDFVNLTGYQVIDGDKKFNDKIEIGKGSGDYISGGVTSSDHYIRFTINNNNTNSMLIGETNIFSNCNIVPYNTLDLGHVGFPWGNLYLSGSLKDGTNSVSVADISNGLFNVINASDITNGNKFNSTQLTLLRNGKPTKIVGDFLGIANPVIDSFMANNETTPAWYRASIIGANRSNVNFSSGLCFIATLFVSGDGTANLTNDPSVCFENVHTKNFVGKAFPNYPTTNTSPQVLQIGANGGNLGWANNVPTNAYATNSTTTLQYETINNISISADTTFTLATAPNSTYPEYKANITNSGASDITITLPSGTVIKGNVSISSNTFVIPSGSSVELNIQNGRAIVVEW